jgi:hypothetical protein
MHGCGKKKRMVMMEGDDGSVRTMTQVVLDEEDGCRKSQRLVVGG